MHHKVEKDDCQSRYPSRCDGFRSVRKLVQLASLPRFFQKISAKVRQFLELQKPG